MQSSTRIYPCSPTLIMLHETQDHPCPLGFLAYVCSSVLNAALVVSRVVYIISQGFSMTALDALCRGVGGTFLLPRSNRMHPTISSEGGFASRMEGSD